MSSAPADLRGPQQLPSLLQHPRRVGSSPLNVASLMLTGSLLESGCVFRKGAGSFAWRIQALRALDAALADPAHLFWRASGRLSC